MGSVKFENRFVRLFRTVSFFCVVVLAASAMAEESLLVPIGAQSTASNPDHVVRGQDVRINRRALAAPMMTIELFGEVVAAVRDRIERQPGQTVWVGHLQGNELNSVIVTVRGNTVSGVIYRDGETYRLSVTRDGGVQLLELDLEQLPADDSDELPDGGGSWEASADTTVADGGTVQDLLVVYNQAACNSQGSCAGLEADIVTAVAELNTAYGASDINVTMNLVGMALTSYTGTGASAALNDLRGTSDGQMDEIHSLRDQLGADLVSFIYDGEGCGIGYLGSSSTSAFNVTDEPCLVGNRTMAHELGHNQGAHHDRQTVGSTSTNYNFGYRRCSDGSVDDVGSPYFRTVMSYSCASASRRGLFSNPNRTYLGVPQGIDTSPDPSKAAYNARTLNESATYVAGFRASAATTIPADPSALGALAQGHDAINLIWNDNSADESNFEIQRSLDGLSWATIAILGSNSTDYADNGLQPETSYHYRVRAQNSAGNSGFSNVAIEATQALPETIETHAVSDVFGTGTVAGSYVATTSVGSGMQTITEQHAGGPKHRRKQSYVHGWTFNVAGGAGGVVATIEAWVSGGEGANFYYSLDGGSTWAMMFTVSDTAPGNPQSFALPGGASGSVRMEVRDAAQANGESVDSVMVDHLMVTSYSNPGSPPQAPSNMTVDGTTSGSVTLSFMDNADDEHGFDIRRSASDPAGNCTAGQVVDSIGANADTGTVGYVDSTVSPSTIYWYWALAFNGAGDSGTCSNAAFAETDIAPQISLSANGYKVKGRQQVDLSWAGAAGTEVNVVRDGTIITATSNDGAHTDIIGAKGGGSYSYQVCETDDSAVCSPAQSVVF